MSAPTDEELLDDAKRRYLAAKDDIERLSTKIAQAACPLKLGDEVTIVDGEREYRGIVGYITHLTPNSWQSPVVGAKTGWSAGGKRINKGSQAESKHSFQLTSFNATRDKGKWVLSRQSLEEILGLPKHR